MISTGQGDFKFYTGSLSATDIVGTWKVKNSPDGEDKHERPSVIEFYSNGNFKAVHFPNVVDLDKIVRVDGRGVWELQDVSHEDGIRKWQIILAPTTTWSADFDILVDKEGTIFLNEVVDIDSSYGFEFYKVLKE